MPPILSALVITTPPSLCVHTNTQKKQSTTPMWFFAFIIWSFQAVLPSSFCCFLPPLKLQLRLSTRMLTKSLSCPSKPISFRLSLLFRGPFRQSCCTAGWIEAALQTARHKTQTTEKHLILSWTSWFSDNDSCWISNVGVKNDWVFHFILLTTLPHFSLVYSTI